MNSKNINPPWTCEAFDAANGEQLTVGYYSKDCEGHGTFNEVADIIPDYPRDKVEAHARLITAAPALFEAVEAALNLEGMELPSWLVEKLSAAANIAAPK